MSQDERERYLYLREEMAYSDEISRMKTAREEGLEEGRKEGKQLFLQCIRLKKQGFSKEKIAEEIVLIRYYNVLFYLFFKTGMDDFKRQCLIKKIDDGESMRMKQIQDWCHCHQIPFKTQFTYRKDFSFRVNLWNLYSYCRFKIERQ